SLVAATATALIALLAAVAFEPMFLLFHRLLFPQGNFLFDPATSNLIRLYPEAYWYLLSAALGAAFLGLAAAVAALGAATLRSGRR
ncbi:MAG: DUF1461 domain-containing protein, partial [Candidatus Limnocylindria bacterium]